MPLFLTVLAWSLLKEKPEWRVWCATVIGFCGVLIMMRPTQVTMELATLSGLAAALFHALAAILIKTLSNKESAVHLLLYFPIVAIVILAVPALVRWEDPSLIEWFGLIGVAGLGVQTQWSFIRACRLADMSVIAPFDYSRLLFAAILGYVFFVEIPDYWTIAGAVVIVLTTLYVARRGATS
jgi:drug/metabolite transporter (DMT)-like permease